MLTAWDMKTSLVRLRPPDEKDHLEILSGDNVVVQKAKKEELAARMANKKRYRDLVMSTEASH